MSGWGGPWSSVLRGLTIPEDAGPDDPRWYIGPDDPIASTLGVDAALVGYWADGRAFIISVEQSGGPDVGQLHVWSIDETPNSLKQLVDITHDVPNGTAQIGIANNGYENGVELAAYSQSVPRGLMASVSDLANSAAVTAEATVLTLPATDFYAGRAYECRMVGGIQSATANVNGNFRVRKDNPSGQDLGEFFRYPVIAAGQPYQANGAGRIFTSLDNQTATIVLTLTGTGGSVIHRSTATSPRAFHIYDIGSSFDYPDFPVLA